MMDDNREMDPMEKSNLPEFKLIDSANVVSITEVTDLKNAIQFPVVSNSFTPLAPHKIIIMISVAIGIVPIPNIFVIIFLLLFITCTISFPELIYHNEVYGNCRTVSGAAASLSICLLIHD